MGLGFDEESLQKRGCNRKKKGMSAFFRFRIRKNQISKRAPGSWMRLESLSYFKYLRSGEVPKKLRE